MKNVADAWREISASAARTVGRNGANHTRHHPRDLKDLMQACVDARGGEVSARGRAAELGRRYLSMGDEEKLLFFQLLSDDFSCSESVIEVAVTTFQDATTPDARQQAETALRRALVPPRLTILKQFNAVPDGTKFLVDLRADLQKHLEHDPSLIRLDADLKELLRSWFDVGFLEFQQITWNSSAALLEKLIAYEAVHEIRDWRDLRNRLDSDRRCYALFHPRMPNEPLAFIEVALTRRMAGNIQELLDEEAPSDDPADARAAIFYSITNTQQGLRGVSFGDHLIKQVVARLHNELPHLETFATLSPIPNFRRWLDSLSTETLTALLSEDEYEAFKAFNPEGDVHENFHQALEALSTGSSLEADLSLKAPLIRLCVRYFLSRQDDGFPRDPVARFHLKNGARLERINWLGDTSAKGWGQSAALMVNYCYRLSELEVNHEAYMREGKINTGPEVNALLKGWKTSDGRPLRRLVSL